MPLVDLALTERSLVQMPLRFSLTPLVYAVGEETRIKIITKMPQETVEKFSGHKVEIVSLVFDGKDNLAGLQRMETDLTKYVGMDIFPTTGDSLDPGSYKCRVVIRDLEASDAAVGSAQVEIPEHAGGGLRLHTPLLLVPEGRLAYLENAGTKKAEAASWTEAYPYDRAKYSPVIGEVSEGTTKIYGLVPCLEADMILPDIALTAYLSNSASDERMPLAISVLNKSKRAGSEIFFVEIPLGDIPPGKYVINFEAVDKGTDLNSNAQTLLIIKEKEQPGVPGGK
jgi:hypothetical protein